MTEGERSGYEEEVGVAILMASLPTEIGWEMRSTLRLLPRVAIWGTPVVRK